MDDGTVVYEIPDPTEVATAVPNGKTAVADVVTMSSGVQFRVKVVSKFALGGITERYTKDQPKVPLVFVQAKGRKEPNPDDPDYQEAMRFWQLSLAMAVNNFLILRGSELLPESVPDTLVRHDEQEWADEAVFYGTDINNRKALYLDWVKYVAAPDERDVTNLLYAIGRKSGINQEDVAEAVNRFQR